MMSDDGTATSSSPSSLFDDCFFDEDDTNDSNFGNVNAALKIIINVILARFATKSMATAQQTTRCSNGNNDQSCDLDSTNNSDSNMYSDEDDFRLPGKYIFGTTQVSNMHASL